MSKTSRIFAVLSATMSAFLSASVAGSALAQSTAFNIQTFETPEGLPIWLVEDHSNPIVTMEINFDGGSYNDPEGLEGANSMAMWLFNEGAGDLPAADFQDIMGDESFSISGRGGFENSQINVQFLSENRELVFDMLALALLEPRYDEDAIERARDHYLAQAQRAVNGPGFEFSQLIGPLRYGEGHPFLRFLDGSLDSLPAIQAEDIAQARAKVFGKNNVEINVVGDITPDELAVALDPIFSQLPDVEVKDKRPAPADPVLGAEVVVDFAQPVTYVTVSAPGLDRNDPDYAAMRVANQILGGDGLGSRLFKSVREEAGLVYGIDSSLAAAEDYGRVGFAFQTANETVDEALELAIATWREFAENGPTAAEVESAVNVITGGYPLRFQTSRDIAGYMATLRALELPPDFPSYRNQQFFDVTVEDVKRAARRLYSNQEFLVGMVGRPENREPGVLLPAQ